jgi:aryl-alcohol dehydrogenase-like predicted oxidoreductase
MSHNIFDVNLSRLVVGTAQFGLPYGIANRVGQPSFEKVCEILACAIEGGATTLDTAAAYGESESVLGRALKEIGALDRVTIVSKVLHVKYMEQERTLKNVENWIRNSVVSSLTRLGIQSLPLCLLHDTSDIDYINMLLDLKREGLVQHVGVSVMAPHQMERVISTPGVEAIQISSSMLDQRILRSGDLARAAAAGMMIFVRSIFLQGLIVMPIEDIIPELQEVIPVRRVLQRITSQTGLTMPEMALRYGLSLPGVSGVLTGVETVEQMAANVAIAARGPLPLDSVEEIHSAVPDLPDTILYPWHWPGAMR